MNLVVFVGFCVVQTCFSYEVKRTVANPLWNETMFDKLRNDLLTNYDRYAKPNHHQEVSNVSIGFDIQYLETDELNSTFSVATHLRLSWTDPKLVWNEDDYDGLPFLALGDHEIWHPDLYLLNSASSGGEPVARYGNALAFTYSNGHVLWVTPLRFTALCQFDLFYWPFDTQHCQLKFGSWSYSSRDLKLVLNQINYEFTIDVAQWNVTNKAEVTEVMRDLYPDSFHQVSLTLKLVRKSSCVSTTVATAVILVSVLVLVQQLVSQKNSDAVILPLFVSTAISLCLLYFSTNVAAIGATAPWLVTFFSTCLILNVLSLIKLVMMSQKHSVPWIVKMQLQGKLRQILLLNDLHFKDHAQKHVDWHLLTVAIDRIFFLCYAFILVVLFLVYLV